MFNTDGRQLRRVSGPWVKIRRYMAQSLGKKGHQRLSA